MNAISNADFYIDCHMRFSPFPHQETEFREHRDSQARALLWSMRCGKTKSCIDLACYLLEEQKIKTILIVAPNGVHENWVSREIPAHLWHSMRANVAFWRSSSKKIAEDIEARIKEAKPLFLSINSEALMLDRVLKLIGGLLKRGPALLIVDESHDFRRPGAKRTKRIRSLSRHFAYRRILTGTLVENSPLAAYSQFEILQPGALGVKTYGEFKYLYTETAFRPGARHGQESIVGYKNLDKMSEKIARWSSKVGREGMPPFVHTVHDFEIKGPQWKMYQTLKKSFILALDSGKKVAAAEGGARMIKMQQVLSGFIIDETGSVESLVPFEENPRLLALSEVLENLEGKSIIWCRFKEDIRLVKKLMEAKGLNSVEYHGGTSPKDRQASIEAFMKDPSCMIFIGQPKAGGTGINLSSASNVIWYSHVFDAIDRAQASERATQIGGKSITITDLSAMHSLDNYILSKLKDKKSISSEVITAKDL